MPAAARQSERRPSAPITSRAATVAAALSATVTPVVAGFDRRGPRPRSARATASSRARASSAANRCRFSMLWPKASSPISAAAKRDLRRADQAGGGVDDAHAPEAAPPAPRSRPRRRASPARSRNPPAARWCGGRRPAGGRSARSRCRPRRARSPPSARPGRRPRSPLPRLIAAPCHRPCS